MTPLSNITADAVQDTTVTLADGSIVELTMTYLAAIERWSINVNYGTSQINGINVCVHPNLLRSFRNVLPFGLMVTSSDDQDPINQGDFVISAGALAPRCAIYLLDQTAGNTDVTQVEQTVYGSPA
jgi:hypothetical protein